MCSRLSTTWFTHRPLPSPKGYLAFLISGLLPTCLRPVRTTAMHSLLLPKIQVATTHVKIYSHSLKIIFKSTYTILVQDLDSHMPLSSRKKSCETTTYTHTHTHTQDPHDNFTIKVYNNSEWNNSKDWLYGSIREIKITG